jgi:hypothetical protein
VGKRQLGFCIYLVTFWLCMQTAQADSLTVSVDKAAILAAPNEDAKIVSYLARGKSLESAGKPKNGFYQLKTKSGRRVFIKASDVEVGEGSIDADLVSEEASHKSKDFRRFRLDGGGSVGSSNQGSFYEINLGISYYVTEWLIWRNAPFFRFQSGAPNSFGLDTSVRGQYSPPIAAEFSPTLMMGAGFRFINTGSHAPFAEAGLGLRVSDIQIQLGVKYIAGKLLHADVEDEVIFNGGFTVRGSF